MAVMICIHGVYMSTVVSVRIDDELIETIRKLGYKPSDYMVKILNAQLRLERSKKSLRWFKKHRFKADGTSGADLIRRDRDSR
jgi:hypothetical protein